MFSFLDGINQFLSYISIESKTKNRIYTILGILGDLYLFYVSISFIRNDRPLFGLGILAVAIILTYFLYLNWMYYFTKREAKFDITPLIYKWLHIKPKVEQEDKPLVQGNTPAVASNGLFDARKTMPAVMVTSPAYQRNIDTLANKLISRGILQADYGGMSKHELTDAVKHERHHRVFAIGEGIEIPYFKMEQNQQGQYFVYAGMNAADALPVGMLSRVGFQDITQLNQQQIKLYLADAFLVGGKYEAAGRSGIMEYQDPYAIQIRVAYQRK